MEILKLALLFTRLFFSSETCFGIYKLKSSQTKSDKSKSLRAGMEC